MDVDSSIDSDIDLDDLVMPAAETNSVPVCSILHNYNYTLHNII